MSTSRPILCCGITAAGTGVSPFGRPVASVHAAILHDYDPAALVELSDDWPGYLRLIDAIVYADASLDDVVVATDLPDGFIAGLLAAANVPTFSVSIGRLPVSAEAAIQLAWTARGIADGRGAAPGVRMSTGNRLAAYRERLLVHRQLLRERHHMHGTFRTARDVMRPEFARYQTMELAQLPHPDLTNLATRSVPAPASPVSWKRADLDAHATRTIKELLTAYASVDAALKAHEEMIGSAFTDMPRTLDTHLRTAALGAGETPTGGNRRVTPSRGSSRAGGPSPMQGAMWSAATTDGPAPCELPVARPHTSDTASAPPATTTPPAPLAHNVANGVNGQMDRQVIAFRIADHSGGDAGDRHLPVDSPVVGVFSVGPPDDRSLLPPDLPITDIGPYGLETTWRVRSIDIEFRMLTGVPEADRYSFGRLADDNGQPQWWVEFVIVVPQTGRSVERFVEMVPRRTGPVCLEGDVRIGSGRYRTFDVPLIIDDPALVPAPTQRRSLAVAVSEKTHAAARHTNISPVPAWQREPGRLGIDISQLTLNLRRVNGRGADHAYDHRELNVDAIARAAEKVRGRLADVCAVEHKRFEAIDPDELDHRLSRFRPAGDWSRDAARGWEASGGWHSPKVSLLAEAGRALHNAVFQRGTKARRLMDSLIPGERVDITWFQQLNPRLLQVPWGLMFRGDIPDGGPLDMTNFLGLRHRICFTAYETLDRSRALGKRGGTALLYFGADEDDPNGIESRHHDRHLRRWGIGVQPTNRFDARPSRDKSHEIRSYLLDDAADPGKFTYVFCPSYVDNDDVGLQFDRAPDDSTVIRLDEFAHSYARREPFVFGNTCESAVPDLHRTYSLQDAFVGRARAFVGTECEVPTAFASRFAAAFFHFLYSPGLGPISTGEAFTQARRFFWIEYGCIGGLIYSYVNDYDLHMESDELVSALAVSGS